MRDPYVLVVAAGSPLADRATAPTWKDMAELELIGHKHCRLLERIEGDARRPLNFVFRSDHNQTVQALVATGVGSALVPRLTMDDEDETTVLIELPKVQPRAHLAGVAPRPLPHPRGAGVRRDGAGRLRRAGARAASLLSG